MGPAARAEANAGPKPPVSHLLEPAGIGARRLGVEHAPGDRLEIGAEMDRALDHDDALFGRIDAEVREDRPVEALAALGADHDADVRPAVEHPEHGRRPQVGDRAASRPVVSDVAPAPGLSCTSAITAGLPDAVDMAARTAAAGGIRSS